MDVFQRVKTLTELHGWSIYELSKRADLDSSAVGKMFQKGSTPTIPTLEKLAKAFGLTMSQFFLEEEEGAAPYPLTQEERKVIEAWNFLTDSQKKLVYHLMLDMHRPPEP